MEALLNVFAIKAVGALLLALTVAMSARYIRRPAVIHALWVVVLLELVVPPIIEVGVLPRPEAAAIVAAAPVMIDASAAQSLDLWPVTPATRRDADRAIPAFPMGLPGLLLGGWLAGVFWILALTALRCVRLRRLLASARDAPPALQTATQRLASRLGLRRCPAVRVVSARISPLVRGRLGRSEILFPDGLLERLATPERDALLTHELAHVRRGDPWVRYLEWVAGTLFWWHPVVGWVRRRLRSAEERCCDALVVRTLPRHARDYARGLVKTVEFLVTSRTEMPFLASGVGEAQDLEERLTMIVKRTAPGSSTRSQKLALTIGALLILAVFPTWADRDTNRSDDPSGLEPASGDIGDPVLALERRAVELERQLQEVRMQQMMLRHELEQRHESIEIERLAREAARHEAAGRDDDAAELRRQQGRLRAQLELERERYRIERDALRRMVELETPLRMTQIELEALDRDRARRRGELAAQAHEMERALQHEYRQQNAASRQLETEALRIALDGTRAELDLARESGDVERARQLARQLALHRRELELSELARTHEQEDGVQEAWDALEALEAEMAWLAEQGRAAEAEELRQRILEMQQVREDSRRDDFAK